MNSLDYQRWLKLWGASGAKGDAQAPFDFLIRHYSEPTRYYHNAQHIADCLRELDLMRSSAHDALALELAIWFHDVIYDSKAHDNEEQSARCARQWLGEGDLTNAVTSLILITRHAVIPTEPDAQLIVDIDLSILGQEESRFHQYEKRIREEYSWVPEKVFAAKRAEVLEGFLARRKIFSTTSFFQRYEENARRNLVGSIKRWRSLS